MFGEFDRWKQSWSASVRRLTTKVKEFIDASKSADAKENEAVGEDKVSDER